jgi:hypothetical protein
MESVEKRVAKVEHSRVATKLRDLVRRAEPKPGPSLFHDNGGPSWRRAAVTETLPCSLTITPDASLDTNHQLNFKR